MSSKKPNSQPASVSRFLYRNDEEIYLDSDGLLIRLTGLLTSSRLLSLEQVAELPGGLIIAEGGMGKSTYIQALESQYVGASTRLVRLAEYSGEPATLWGEVQQWADKAGAGPKTLLLDGLDEAPYLAPSVLRYLRNRPEELTIWISSRANSQIRSIQNECDQLGLSTYRLAPLSKENLIELAEKHGSDGNQFFEAVTREGIIPICSKPIGCIQAILEFVESGLLGVSERDLWLSGISRLCDENPSPTRGLAPSIDFSLEQIIDCASWVAICMELSGSQFVWSNESSYCPNSALALDVLASADVPIELLQTALSRGVFTPIGDGRHRVSHPLYQDFLASLGAKKFISAHHWPSLFFTQDRTGILPQHIGVVIQLAVTHEALLNDIASIQPEALVLHRDTVEIIGRAKLVSALLNRASCLTNSDRSYGELQRHLPKLHHPELEMTLRACMEDEDILLETAELAIEIATECKCHGLSDLLADSVLDRSKPLKERINAGWALCRIGTSSEKGRLKTLLPITPKDDPVDGLRGLVLRALWPEHLTSEELVTHLSSPQKANYSGTYSMFLNTDLPNTLSSQISALQLRPLLEWSIPHLRNRKPYDSLGDLARLIYTYAWRLGSLGLTDLLALGYMHSLRKYHSPFLQSDSTYRDGPIPPLDLEVFHRDEQQRHAVMMKIVSNPIGEEKSELSRIRVHDYPMYSQRDLPWLLEMVQIATGEEQERWSQCITSLMTEEEINNHYDEFEALHSQMPGLFEHPKAVRQNRAKACKEWEEKEAAWENERIQRDQEAQQSQIDLENAISKALDDEDTKPEAFGGIASWLFAENGSRGNGSLDITEAPIWSKLDHGQQDRLVDLAERYLKEVTHQPTEPGKLEYSLAQALTVLRLIRPEVFESLDESVWRKCGVELLKAIFSENHVHMEPLLVRLAGFPEIATECLLGVVEQEIEQGHIFVIRKWGERLSIDQAERIVQQVAQPDIPTKVRHHALEDLIAIDQDQVVRSHLESLFSAGWASPGEREFHKLRGLFFELAPESLVEQVLAAIEQKPEWGKEWLMAVSGCDALITPFSKCAPEQIARFFAWLDNRYPSDAEPEHAGAFTPNSIDYIYTLKRNLISHLTRSGRPGCSEALKDLFLQIPSKGWLLDCEKESRRHEAQAQAPVLSIDQIKELRSEMKKSRLLVNNITDLSELVCGAIEGYQKWLQGDNPRIVDLWERTGAPRPRDEEYLSDHLKSYLDLVLTNGIVINREVQIRRKLYKEGKPGSRTDVWVQAVDENGYILTYCIEVKGNWNGESNTALKKQLIDKYLSGGTATGGMLLVGWFECSQWDVNDYRLKRSTSIWADKATGLSDLKTQVDVERAKGHLVSAQIVDCSLI